MKNIRGWSKGNAANIICWTIKKIDNNSNVTGAGDD